MIDNVDVKIASLGLALRGAVDLINDPRTVQIIYSYY